MKPKTPLPRATFSLPPDIEQFLKRIMRENKRRTLQAAFEDGMRGAMVLQGLAGK